MNVQTGISGSQPGVGSFIAHTTPDGQDWCIQAVINDEVIERWCSTWSAANCNGLTKVYAILRELGFTLEGFQTAEVLPLRVIID